jgi:NifU-like protein involved in Fe-S cluster formation
MAYSSEVVRRVEDAMDVTKQRPKEKELQKGASDVGFSMVGAPACGDVMKVMIKVDENGIITDSTYKVFGCAAAIASSQFAMEIIRNKTLEEALTVSNEFITKELCLPPVKRHCSMLAEQAIKMAIKDYMKKNLKETVKEA